MNATPQGAGDFEPANRWVILTREMTEDTTRRDVGVRLRVATAFGGFSYTIGSATIFTFSEKRYACCKCVFGPNTTGWVDGMRTSQTDVTKELIDLNLQFVVLAELENIKTVTKDAGWTTCKHEVAPLYTSSFSEICRGAGLFRKCETIQTQN